ncbi:unnamed protein product [Clonostachys chloroleuca]|uniref:F-box domain-containing protein n=1 Tax=Clonostachys chloroleuca TaxID=1926264 RepID=A0AA35MCG6_9HYPO|nr:unnamed protein product [Clonostachys chloroleuca]
MAPASPVLASLPVELWRHVLQNLVLHRLAPDQAQPDPGFLANRNALRELCLTSRMLSAMARPLLYETIVLYPTVVLPFRHVYDKAVDPLVRLTLTLAENRSLRPWIKTLAVLIPLSNTDDVCGVMKRRIHELWPEFCNYIEQPGVDERDILSAVGLITDPGEEPVPRIVAALLAMAPNLESLLLLDLLGPGTEVFDEAVLNLVDSQSTKDGFLSELKTLQVQAAFGRNRYAPSANYWDTAFEGGFSTCLINLPRLGRMDVTCNYIDNINVDVQIRNGPIHLNELNLIVTGGVAPLGSLIGLASNLSSLSIDFRAPEPLYSITGALPEADLNPILLERARTLERLVLRTTTCPHKHISEQLGPLEKLICLPSLRRLTHLCIEPYLFLDWLNVNTWPRFLRTLPPNIVYLKLLFVPERGEDLARIWARSGMGAALRAPAHKWRAKVPHLRHIHLEPLPFSQHAVEEIKQDLQLAGIALTWRDLEAVELSLDLASLRIH